MTNCERPETKNIIDIVLIALQRSVNNEWSSCAHDNLNCSLHPWILMMSTNSSREGLFLALDIVTSLKFLSLDDTTITLKIFDIYCCLLKHPLLKMLHCPKSLAGSKGDLIFNSNCTSSIIKDGSIMEVILCTLSTNAFMVLSGCDTHKLIHGDKNARFKVISCQNTLIFLSCLLLHYFWTMAISLTLTKHSTVSSGKEFKRMITHGISFFISCWSLAVSWSRLCEFLNPVHVDS